MAVIFGGYSGAIKEYGNLTWGCGFIWVVWPLGTMVVVFLGEWPTDLVVW